MTLSLSNNLQPQVDQPVWEWTRFAPIITGKPAGAMSDWQDYFIGGTPRYSYYIQGLSFYRYDTISDSWDQLTSPPITAPIYNQSLEYSPVIGYYGKAIGPGSARNTIQLAALNGKTLVGNRIAIIGGTGAGQERNIVDVSPETVWDSGEVVAYAAGPNPASVQDTNLLTARKTWQYNQWRDYQLRITYTTTAGGQNQLRKILYNNNNTLDFSDFNHATIRGDYSAPLATAISNLSAWYQIESSVVYVDSNWATPPDSTSKFVVKGGGFWMMSGFATTPWYTMMYYDTLSDVWYLKGSQTTTLYSNTWDTYENVIEVVSEAEAGSTTDWKHSSPLTANVGAISVAAAPFDRRTLIDAGQYMPINKYANQMIKIVTGTGRGQCRTIVGNSINSFTISRDWETVPDSTSTYQVIGDSDKIYTLPGFKQSVMGMYSQENDVMATGRHFDFGVARTMFAELAPKGIAQATITGGNGGTGGTYLVGDILTLTNNGLYTGIGGQVRVETVSSGQVATVSVYNAGAGYFVSSTPYATTGGGGTGCTLVVNANTVNPQPPIGITGITASAAANVGGLLTVAPSAAGSGYSVNDLLTVSTGTNGLVRVTSVSSTGGVTGLAVEQQGYGYTNAGSPYATTFTTAQVRNGAATDLRAIASGCTVTVTVTNNSVATTGIAHNFKIGDVVWIGGLDALPAMTSQAYCGGLRTIAGVPSTTSFTYSIAGSQVVGTPAAISATIATNYAITAAVVNAGGTGYTVGDLLTCTTGGSGGTVRVTAVNAGVVTGVCLVSRGQSYATGTSNTTGGTGGNNCTVTLTAATAGVVNALATSSAGQGFGVVTSAAGANPTYAIGTGIARASVYNGGSGYAPGDLLSVTGGGDIGVYGAGGVVKVLTTTAANVTPAGAVLTVQIMNFGQGYSTGVKNTTNLGNNYAAGLVGGDGGGSGCTINVDAVGSVYSCAAAGGNNLLVNITGVSSTGGISSVAVADGGTGYSSTTYTVLSSAAAAIFSAESLAGTNIIIDTCKNWLPNELVGKLVETQLGGPAAVTGGIRRIIANGSHAMLVQPAITAPVSGQTKYVIFDGKSLGTEATYKTSDYTQYSWGVATGGTAGTLGSAGGTLIDNSTGLGTVAIVAQGTGYSVGDVLTLVTTGNYGTVKVTAVTGGKVTAISLVTPGTGYSISSTESTTAVPNNGSGCTIKVLTSNAKNWDINRWAGYKVKIVAGKGVNSAQNELLILSNTANTLTLNNNFVFSAAPDTTTVYAIMDNWGVCASTGVLLPTVSAGGTNYRVGDILWVGTAVGAFIRVTTVTGAGVVSGLQLLNSGSGSTGTMATTCITNSLASSCTITATTTAAGGSTYWNDPFQNWGSNGANSGSLVGKMIRAVAGTPVTGVDYAITQVASATQVVTGAVTPDGNTQYSILCVMTRSAAASVGVTSLVRLYNTSVLDRARYMVSWRGNSSPSIDRYDIVQDIWETLSPTPNFEVYTLGMMSVYDGGDRIYFTSPGLTGRVMYLDLINNIIVPCTTIPYGHNTAIPGNRMFIIGNTTLQSASIKYLYLMRHTGTEMWRVLIYW